MVLWCNQNNKNNTVPQACSVAKPLWEKVLFIRLKACHCLSFVSASRLFLKGDKKFDLLLLIPLSVSRQRCEDLDLCFSPSCLLWSWLWKFTSTVRTSCPVWHRAVENIFGNSVKVLSFNICTLSVLSLLMFIQRECELCGMMSSSKPSLHPPNRPGVSTNQCNLLKDPFQETNRI